MVEIQAQFYLLLKPKFMDWVYVAICPKNLKCIKKNNKKKTEVYQSIHCDQVEVEVCLSRVIIVWLFRRRY